MTRVRLILLCALVSMPLIACHVQHDGSFEHDAGFVVASASVAVQIGKPPSPPTASAASSSAPVGPPPAPTR